MSTEASYVVFTVYILFILYHHQIKIFIDSMISLSGILLVLQSQLVSGNLNQLLEADCHPYYTDAERNRDESLTPLALERLHYS